MTEVTPAMTSTNYFDLGAFTRTVTLSSPEAQIWFNRGLIWSYAFNHEEAVKCFEQVITLDPSCIMGYWGIAYASGPHYNKPWLAFDPKDLARCYGKGTEMIKKAATVSTNATPIEQALMNAIAFRFPAQCIPDDLAAANGAYATAMKKVYEEFGTKDLDVLVLAADALMNMAPWGLFDSKNGQPNLSTPVLEIKEILTKGMSFPEAETHPGLLHLWIHLMEMSTTPEAALIGADKLRYIVPDSGHLQHMPSHIYLLVGDYRQAMDANLKATVADDKFFSLHPDMRFLSIYRLHNLHSLIYAAMMAGQSRLAVETCDRLEAVLTRDLLLLDSPPMADWAESFNTSRMHVLVRYGMWDAIKALPIPDDEKLYCVTIAFTYYAKGIAFAATGDVLEADKYRDLFREATKRVPPTRLDFPNKVLDLLSVADAMLDGEIAYRRGHYDEAFEALRLAISRDDSLTYSEPWGWMVPTRHAYAALLLEQGNVEEAATAYAEDLGLDDVLASAHQAPLNIWSLQGYHECLKRLGRNGEANIIRQQLTVAEAIADISVQTSCFCSVPKAKAESNCTTCP